MKTWGQGQPECFDSIPIRLTNGRTRWAVAGALETEKHFRKIMGHRDLWMLKAALDEDHSVTKEPQNTADEGRLAA